MWTCAQACNTVDRPLIVGIMSKIYLLSKGAQCQIENEL